jgi:hypothetical protein
MILALLAQANTQLPDNYKGIGAIVVGSIVVLVLVGGIILIGAQRTRAALAKEIKMELAEAAKAIEVKVQSPVTFQTDAEFVTVETHEKAIQELRAAQAKDTAEIKTELLRHGARRAEIYKQNEKHGEAIAALKTETASQTRQIHQLSDQIERLPEKIKNLLRK